MSRDNQRRFPLQMSMSGSDPNYYWPTNPPSLKHIPYFQAIPIQLAYLLDDSSHRNTLGLSFAPSDCITVSGTKNCTEACLNPKSLFQLGNIKTCVLMASAALLVQNETYSVDMSNAATVETTESFLVPNFTDFNAVGVLTNVANCITQSCTNSNLGDCATSVRDVNTIRVVARNLVVIATRLSSYCALAKKEINSDIAGPGLVVAYLLQIVFAVIFHLCLKFTTTWIRKMFHLFSWFRGRRGREETRKRGKLLQSDLAASRFGAAVVSSLVEFQEVQIYFVASIQVATLISFNPGNPNAGSVNSYSYGGALLNSVTITSLSITSLSCILLVQRSLQRVGMHWWYPFITMTVTYVLALVIFAVQGDLMPSVDGLWERFDSDSQLTLCGGRPSPMTYCRPPYALSFIRDAGSVYAACFAGSLVWLGLFVDQVASTADSITKKLPTSLHQRLRVPREGKGGRGLDTLKCRLEKWKKGKIGAWVSKAYSILISLAVLWMVCGYITTLRPVVARVDIGDTSGWSFGQLIALAVWIPTFVKHVYYNIFGIEGGFEERIAANYTISRDDDPKKPATSTEGRRLPHATTYPLLSVGAHGATDSGMDSIDENTHRTW
ncbi:hypothetical protein B0T25DRAFT_567020 [Lasiosphaeria hispida]|uniref:Uncharacterized protein n=1 Tax=Lasiosphaeria hispida TaxID=260671 RepID=A0AAJ0HMS8_9PEZI|nr:hypothetical protein B0T25DRAFT_567020 [Lasiosphaeria hispida]